MDLSLSQLLVYPVVQNLHNNWAEANLRVSLALDTQAVLVKENLRLSNELREAIAANHRYNSLVDHFASWYAAALTFSRSPALGQFEYVLLFYFVKLYI